MRYSNNLLKRYLSLDIDPERIASQLTLKICEVEEIYHRLIPDEVVIGKVTSTRQHPQADKLIVCQIDCGSKGNYQICTGGENVVAESYVPVALPGCFLPAINLAIEPREMRGEESNGMICSKQELGIPEDLEEHWIWTLQYAPHTDLASVPQLPDMDDITDKDLGTPLGEKYPWLHNRMVDVENKTITHRPDLFGHFGMSIELDTIFPGEASFAGGKKYMTQFMNSNILETLANATPSPRNIIVQTNNLLTYTLVELTGVHVAPSDLLLRTLLYDLGLQPRNNRVDFSNLFMYLTGQPVHFFDAHKVQGDIIIRQAKDNESFIDLFGVEHQLIESDLVIADQEKILALAGVIGSSTSGIDENTTDILVEIANFDPVCVRKTGTRLGLRTDAELRFEKEINPIYTLHTLTFLLDELQYFSKSLGGYTFTGLSWWSSPTTDAQPIRKISLDTLRVVQMLFGEDGASEQTALTDEGIAKILTSLGCVIDTEWNVTIPHRRGPADLTEERDLIEEVARIYGFENISPKVYLDESNFVPFAKPIVRQRTIEQLLAATYGYDQIETYPWLEKRWIDLFRLPVNQLYTMKNSLSPEQYYLRDTLLWSMLSSVEKNAPFFEEIHLFEVGKTRQQNRPIAEHDCLCIISRQKTPHDRSTHGLLQVKGIIAGLANSLSWKGKWEYLPTNNSLFHPHQQATVTLNQQPIGSLQTIHAYQLQQSKLPPQGQLVIAELSLTSISEITSNQKTSRSKNYETLQDQIIWRDLNFTIDRTMHYGSVVEAVQKIKEIKAVELFDLYAGERLPEGKKSIGLRIKLIGDGSLQTEQVNTIVQQAVKAVENAGGELRG